MGLSRTPLYAEHLRLGARMVPFGGWELPLHYGSQLGEHRAVRRTAGMFDVSHMRALDLDGAGAMGLLRRLLANDVARLRPGRALYTCMLDERGGTLDDLIVYARAAGGYRLILNAATAASDLAWIQAQAEAAGPARLAPRADLAMLAVQGPEARARAHPVLPAPLDAAVMELPAFHAAESGDRFLATTGYTGEDGFELLLPAASAAAAWQALLAAGIQPCGLGARDTLRLEAGLNLYGQDMDASVSPLECGLDWTVAWDPPERDFIGRGALTAQRAAPARRRFVGLVLTGRAVPRAGQRVAIAGQPAGVITSGGFGPTLGRAIALARLDPGAEPPPGTECTVEIRGRPEPARLVKPPFVRRGQVIHPDGLSPSPSREHPP